MNRVPPESFEILDLNHLRRQTAGDGELEQELLSLFEAQCARLRPLIGNPGPHLQRADAAHTLKGSARAIGAWRLGSVADQLETAFRGRGAELEAPALVQQLDEAIEATNQALAQRPGQDAA